MGWMPIESAPRDGTVFIAWRFYACAVRWRPDADPEFPWEAFALGSHPCTAMMPNAFQEHDISMTHWMPLPEPPK